MLEHARSDPSVGVGPYWVPGVNHLGTQGGFGRWAFAEFTDVFRMQDDFAKKVEAEFRKMIESVAP